MLGLGNRMSTLAVLSILSAGREDTLARIARQVIAQDEDSFEALHQIPVNFIPLWSDHGGRDQVPYERPYCPLGEGEGRSVCRTVRLGADLPSSRASGCFYQPSQHIYRLLEFIRNQANILRAEINVGHRSEESCPRRRHKDWSTAIEMYRYTGCLSMAAGRCSLPYPHTRPGDVAWLKAVEELPATPCSAWVDTQYQLAAGGASRGSGVGSKRTCCGRLCWQTLPPRQSLHLLLMRSCSHMLDPLHSLHLIFSRL